MTAERWDLNDRFSAKLVLPVYDIASTQECHAPPSISIYKRVTTLEESDRTGSGSSNPRLLSTNSLTSSAKGLSTLGVNNEDEETKKAEAKMAESEQVCCCDDNAFCFAFDFHTLGFISVRWKC